MSMPSFNISESIVHAEEAVKPVGNTKEGGECLAIMNLQAFFTTEGYSGAELAAVCNEAENKALEEAEKL